MLLQKVESRAPALGMLPRVVTDVGNDELGLAAADVVEIDGYARLRKESFAPGQGHVEDEFLVRDDLQIVVGLRDRLAHLRAEDRNKPAADAQINIDGPDLEIGGGRIPLLKTGFGCPSGEDVFGGAS